MRILILGGTSEASELAKLLASNRRFETTLSLAGRTASPRPQPVATRSGGFGGADGLARWLEENAISAVIDATHPFAAQMSANAVAACASTGVALGSIVRPPWSPEPGDAWQLVPTFTAAADALGPAARRVFLGLGRQELDAFVRAPQHHYIARVIDPPEKALPPDTTLIRDRGPFDRDAEEKLLTEQRIEVVVSKNSGGDATYAKIGAARALGLPVIMIERPEKPAGDELRDPREAIAWLDHVRSPRGV